MGLHEPHLHGRVFRGLEARHFLEQQKRDLPTHNTNHNHIKLNVPADFVQKNAAVETVVSVVYKTMSQTFSGAVGGYETLASPPKEVAQTDVAQVGAASTTQTANANESAAYVAPSRAQRPEPATTSVANYGGAVVGGTPLSNSRGPSVVAGVPLQATHSADAQTSQQDNGMTGGAKAGLAIGLLLGFALIAGLVFFCLRRRKNRAGQELLIDEKRSIRSSFGNRGPVAAAVNHFSTSTIGSGNSVRTAATAPRLSLRPVTQFLPMLGGNRQSTGNALDAANPAMSEKSSAWERRPQNAAQNPFNDATVISEKQANPFDEDDGKAGSIKSGNHSQKSSWEGIEPPTPNSTKSGTVTEVRVSGDAAGAVATPPVPRQPNNVHRVQLDFKPSMEDELELRSGQLVRMLHEYDDGWALCIAMDRSKQGVAPRTCLSKLPVKPRPNGPPPQNGPRPQGPPPGMPRPSNPQNGAMYPRALTPTSQDRQRAHSDAQRPQSPVDMLSRKPVPGQAL